jgi:hypothetical protein
LRIQNPRRKIIVLEHLYPGSSLLLIGIVVVLDVLAIVQIWRGTKFDVVGKVFWSVVVVAVPYAGAIGWLAVWTIARLTGSKALK